MEFFSTRSELIRRDFVRLLSGMAGGLLVSLPGNRSTDAEELPVKPGVSLDTAYLEKGLNALARAHHMSSMAGHLGASFIAGYFVAKQRPDIDPIVLEGIKDDLGRVLDGESVFGKKMSKRSKRSDTELFESFPKQKADETLIDGIAEGLEKSISQPRQSGHNVIFASLAIRALEEHPEFSTPAVVDGILKLMALFENETPGSGYYGKKKGRMYGNKVTLSDGDGTPEYDDLEGMITAVLDEAINLQPETHRVGYGGLIHVINHSAAIVNLATSGYDHLIPRAIKSHRQHLRLWRSLPNVADEKGPLQVSKFTPHSADYWNPGRIPYDRALLTHRVKTMFGFDQLASAIDDEKKETTAYDRLRYMM